MSLDWWSVAMGLAVGCHVGVVIARRIWRRTDEPLADYGPDDLDINSDAELRSAAEQWCRANDHPEATAIVYAKARTMRVLHDQRQQRAHRTETSR